MKGFINRNFYHVPFWPRRLSEYKAVCDICNKSIGFMDYGYMCIEHGDMIYKSNLGKIPKFILRYLLKQTVVEK